MRKAILFTMLILLVAGASGVRAGGNANFVVGMRSLDDPLWETPPLDFDRQTLLGVNVDFGGKDWPVHLLASVHNSFEIDDEPDFDRLAWVAELGFGFVWIANRNGNVRPYIGGGLSSVRAYVDLDYTNDNADTDDADHSMGFFLDGGVFFRLGARFNVGFDFRMVRDTEVTIFGTEGDADYEQFGLILGFGW